MVQRSDKASIPHWERDTKVSSAMLAALAEHPLTFDLDEQQRLDLVELAMRERKFNDLAWLEATVLRIRAGEQILATEEGKAETTAATAPPPAAEIPVSLPVQVQSQEHLEALLEAHTAWIKQTLEPGKELVSGRANFKGNDLRTYVFEGFDLRAANLEGCDLRGANLIGTNLAGANLTRAQLQEARLDHAKLRRTNLSHADLSRASLQGADLRQIVTHFTKWEGADLRGTVLETKDVTPHDKEKRAEQDSETTEQ